MKTKTILINNHKVKISLVKGEIKEGDFVISKHRFEAMDSKGIYNSNWYKPIDVPIEKVILINIGSINNPEMVLGFSDGGACGSALQALYSIVDVKLV